VVYKREPNEGDYWCKGLLTSDFLEAVTHAVEYSQKCQEAVTVSRYVQVGLWAPTMQEVAVIRKPQGAYDER
jgi:hypothetical protein